MSTEFEENLRTRVREELQRLKLSFAEASRAMGEKDSLGLRDVCNGRKRATAELLYKLSTVGADVFYILTGSRNPVQNSAIPLKPDEAALLDNYRASPPDQQRLLSATSAAFAQRPKKKSA